jgi:ATP-binding cassette subfamily B protein
LSESQNTYNNTFLGEALDCLCAVANHHGVTLDPERLIHDYSLEIKQLTPNQVSNLAQKSGLKSKVVSVTVEELSQAEKTLPLILPLANGSYVVLAGTQLTDEGCFYIIYDPSTESEELLRITEEQLTSQWSNQAIFIKRVYSISDPNQPFGLRWFLPEILKHRRIFRDVAIAAITLHILGLATPIFFQLVIDKVLAHQSFSTLYVLTIGISLALLFEAGFGYLRQYLLLDATKKIDISLVTKTFSHLLALPINYFERSSAGVTVRHMQQVEQIRQFLTGQLFLTVLDASVLIFYLPLLWFYSPMLATVVLGFTAAIGLVIVVLINPYRSRLRTLYNAEADRQAMLFETINGMRTVKSLALEPVQRKLWDNSAAHAVNSHFNVAKISISANSVTGLLQKLMSVSIIALGASQVFDSIITVGALIAFNMLSGRVVGPLVQLVSLVHQYQETALSVKMLGTVMNHPPERLSSHSGLRPDFKGHIQFENVSFRYQADGANVLDKIHLNIPPGSIVGIVGKSGSGKSTLTKLLQGLYSPQEGVIRLDGTDLREMDLDHLRRNMGVVLQESFLFKGTVKQNIGISRSDATFVQIDQAAKISGAKEFIEKLPLGYDSYLEESASNLSGGQKQRIAIARAILSKPRFLIFDEATSALDPDSESIFLENLNQIAESRTVLIVSHRLSTLLSCDAILVMDEGRIVDVGVHSELLSRCELYRHLWHQQNRHQVSAQ